MKHYENLSANLTAFFEAINAEKAKNIAEANVIADEARALISRAQINREKHEELCDILGATRDAVSAEHVMLYEVVGNIKDALHDLYESDLPECEVENFVGYCEHCGDEVVTGGAHFTNESDLLCDNCFNAYIEEEFSEADATVEADDTAEEAPSAE